MFVHNTNDGIVKEAYKHNEMKHFGRVLECWLEG